MIIGIDSSVGTAVAVVSDDGFIHAQLGIADTRGHAERIGELIVDALAAAQLSADAISHVAYGTGPGPFTGLRVGIAAAQAFAWARELPLVPVCSHDAVAMNRILADALTGVEPAPFAVVTDARRRELAYTVYAGADQDGLPERIHPPALLSVSELDQRLTELGAPRVDATEIPASALAIVAARALAAGRTVADTQPLYLRAPDVTLPSAPKRVTA